MLDLAVRRGFGPPESKVDTVHGGSVVYCPAPNGTVRITGLDARGAWIAEYSCLLEDYEPRLFTRMKELVEKRARKLTLMG